MKKFFIVFCLMVFSILFALPTSLQAEEEGVDMYRMYNPYSGEHLYTANAEEKDNLSRIGWQYEGVGWVAPKTSSIPVYRLYNPYSGDHLYTTDAQERNDLVKIGWRYEEIGWYSDDQQRVPLYRQFNPYALVGTHNYTTSMEENDDLVKIGWKAEGIGWYGIAKGTEQNSLSRLSTTKNRVVDGNGNPFTIKGISTHGLAWFPQIINEKSFSNFKYEFGLNTVRLAMYTAEYGGYCTGGNQTQLENLIDEGVKLCQQRKMYCIIDWHILSDGNPLTYESQAKVFFEKMAQKYGSLPNVIFEICNEPNGNATWNDVTKYANTIIPAIRKYSNNLILVGTPTWSQDIQDPANQPLPYSNVAYTLHFYAATHKDDLRNRYLQVVDQIPIVVSEFGICDASGNGAIDEASANEWMRILNEHNTGRILWNASNKAESSSILQPGTDMENWWTNNLTQSGKWLLAQNTNYNPSAPSQPENPTPVQPASLSLKFQKTNGWSEGDQQVMQIAGTIENSGQSPSNSWKFKVTFPNSVSVENHWNCNVTQINEKTIEIQNVDYNGTVNAGTSISDIGINLKSKESIDLNSLKIE